MKLSKNLAALAAFAVLLVLLVGGLSAVQSRMNAIRIDEKLTDTEPLENAPPMVVLTTVALGGFRGLVADWLWLRSNRMQEQGNYFEMVQLASWITKLQPRYPQVWVFHGPHQPKVEQRFASFGTGATAVPISKTGKNALDFHLSFYMGYIASRNPDSKMVVVANDKGYEPMGWQ